MKKFEAFIHSLIKKRILPGISLLVGKGEEILLKKHYGYKSLLPQKEMLKENTLYDLASLTKPLITALLTLYLVEKEKKITLNTNIRKFFPLLAFDINLLHLLTHTSGLPAWYPFYLYGEDYTNQFKPLKLESRPGKKVNYSCVGYILLYYIIEKIAGTSFKEFAQKIIFEPLGLKNTFLFVPEDLKKFAAPTENGNHYEKRLAEKKDKKMANHFFWRDYILQGETHDCNSWYLGGTAGNSGLFSTTEDVFRITREFSPSTTSILAPESTHHFRENLTPFKKSHRTIGFKRNSSFITSGGRALSREAIGHNGVTGTSLWLEPKGGYTFILLTNRIHPVMVDEKKVGFNRIRRKLHRMIVKNLEIER